MNDKDIEIYINKLGKTLLEVRNQKNLSQRELSLKSGIEKTYIRNIEKGKTNPTIKTLLRISSALNITVEQLLVKVAE